MEEKIDTIYKPIPSVEQSDLEFVIPDDPHIYLDLDIKLYVKGKLVKLDGTILDNKHFMREQIISFIISSINATFV